MRAMVFAAPRAPLRVQERDNPNPGDREIRGQGERIVGRVDLIGSNASRHVRFVPDRLQNSQMPCGQFPANRLNEPK
jgi:hypothetical protein